MWGTGKPLREFLFCDDLADACVYLMNNYSGNDFFNVGYGEEVTIRELAEIIKEVVGYEGKIVLDSSKPDGTFRKLTDINRIKSVGWSPKIDLKTGIQITYDWYVNNIVTNDK
jgi:GDP-L-fucose synthase